MVRTDVCASSCLAHGVCGQLACLQAGRLPASSSHALAGHLCGQFAWLTRRRCACRWWARATLRRGALAARREDEESSWCLPCERSACVGDSVRTCSECIGRRKKSSAQRVARRNFLNVKLFAPSFVLSNRGFVRSGHLPRLGSDFAQPRWVKAPSGWDGS